MMRRYFIVLMFDGSRYAGWQRQPDAQTVESCLEEALTLLLRRPTAVVGAGRTDARVHAREMAAHFDTDADVNTENLAYRLNRLLPHDIAVKAVKEVPESMHARFSATRRTYRYYVHTGKNPFLQRYSLQLHTPVDFELMNLAARHLLQTTDFAAFAKLHTDVKTTFCEVSKAEWIRTDADSWYFEITANRFLRNMVRAIVGTLLEVGRGKISEDDFARIIHTHDRCQAGDSAPAHALFLEKVEYENLEI